jgi:hypothetical protein
MDFDEFSTLFSVLGIAEFLFVWVQFEVNIPMEIVFIGSTCLCCTKLHVGHRAIKVVAVMDEMIVIGPLQVIGEINMLQRIKERLDHFLLLPKSCCTSSDGVHCRVTSVEGSLVRVDDTWYQVSLTAMKNIRVDGVYTFIVNGTKRLSRFSATLLRFEGSRLFLSGNRDCINGSCLLLMSINNGSWHFLLLGISNSSWFFDIVSFWVMTLVVSAMIAGSLWAEAMIAWGAAMIAGSFWTEAMIVWGAAIVASSFWNVDYINHVPLSKLATHDASASIDRCATYR